MHCNPAVGATPKAVSPPGLAVSLDAAFRIPAVLGAIVSAANLRSVAFSGDLPPPSPGGGRALLRLHCTLVI